MLDKIKKLDVFLCLLIILSLNSLRDINLAQSLVAIGMFGLIGYNRWLEYSKKIDINEEVRTELENIKSNMSSIMIKNASKPAQSQQEIKRFF